MLPGERPTEYVTTDADRQRVLVVDDERSVADVFAEHLRSAYAVETAYSGAEAISALDDDIDAVLLDRRMPDMAGEAVLEEIRAQDDEPQVAMVTAIDPDFDVIDMPFDDYVVKPVDEAELLETVRRLLQVGDLEAKKRELSSKRITRNVLEIEKSAPELSNHERFQQIEARIEQLEAEIADVEAELAGKAN
jgi:DNA-binding response OmpR family regulator